MSEPRYTITGSRHKGADNANRVVLYTRGECTGGFSPTEMANTIAALGVGESVSYPALRFVNTGPNPAPIVITRNF